MWVERTCRHAAAHGGSTVTEFHAGVVEILHEETDHQRSSPPFCELWAGSGGTSHLEQACCRKEGSPGGRRGREGAL